MTTTDASITPASTSFRLHLATYRRHNEKTDKDYSWVHWIEIRSRVHGKAVRLSAERLATHDLDIGYFCYMWMESGTEEGKKVLNATAVDSGKNRGRINWTNVYTQALSETRHRVAKKLRLGYSYIDGEVIDDSVLPAKVDGVKTATIGKDDTLAVMLAQDYNKKAEIVAEAFRTAGQVYSQPKMDGHRCVARIEADFSCVLHTRSYKEIINYDAIKTELVSLLRNESKKGRLPASFPFFLDGEIYLHGAQHQDFVKLGSKEALTDADHALIDQVQYWVYDCYFPGQPDAMFSERLAFVSSLLSKGKRVVAVTTDTCISVEEITAAHEVAVADGFEGSMVRIDAPYQRNARSKYLLKYKDFDDEEYLVVGFEEAAGTKKGTPIWLMEHPTSHAVFKVTPKGPVAALREIFSHASDYIGSMMTVKFKDKTKDGIPKCATTDCRVADN